MTSLIPNRYEQYMDVSGVVNETITGAEYVTVGGVCILPDTADVLRDSAARLPKWRDSTYEQAISAMELISSTAIVAVAITAYKDPAAWADFWAKSKQYHRELSRLAHDRAGAAFTKAANILKYMLFEDCSAALLGGTVERVGKPTLLDARRRSAVQLSVVCDTDIQGAENIAVFQHLWQHLEGNQPLINELGLSEHVSSVVFATERPGGLRASDEHAQSIYAGRRKRDSHDTSVFVRD